MTDSEHDLITTEADQNVENLIYEIRGQQVMLDKDLARLYGVETRDLNKAVKRNIERFPSNFMFQLTKSEHELLMFQFGTSNDGRGGTRKIPNAFTEQGVAMLAGVLRSKVAVETSIKIMDAFVAMRHYVADNNIHKTLNNVNNKLIEHDEKLDFLFSKFDKKEQLFLPGSTYDAYSELLDIVEAAQNEIVIIDAYADKSLLDVIRETNYKFTLITSGKAKLSDAAVTKFNQQYNNRLKVVKSNSFHDRYIVLDRKTVYHVGASLNRLGKRVSSINKLEDKFIINQLLEYIDSLSPREDV